MSFLIVCVLYLVIPLLLLIFGKWIYAGIAVLAGDKEALQSCNLCEKDNLFFYKRDRWHNDDWRNKGEGNM